MVKTEEKLASPKQTEVKAPNLDFPLVMFREMGLAKYEQIVPALVLTKVDDDEPHRRTLEVFTEQGSHVVRNAVLDYNKVGCWFPLPASS